MNLDLMLDELPADKPVAILMRHAERHPIVDSKDSVEALLTKNGKADARSLGEKFSSRAPLHLFHSPIQRCLQTAEEIAAGARKKKAQAEIRGQIFELGGPYMKDWDAVMKMVFESGAGNFVRRWFDGGLSSDLAVQPDQAAREQLNILRQQLEDIGRGTMLNISHDWNILLVRHHFFDLDDRALGWPDYLEGVAVFPEGGALTMLYGPHRTTIDLD